MTETELKDAAGGSYLKMGDVIVTSAKLKAPTPSAELKTYPKITFPDVKARGE